MGLVEGAAAERVKICRERHEPHKAKDKQQVESRHEGRHWGPRKPRDKHQVESRHARNHAGPRKRRHKHQGRKFSASCPADSHRHTTDSNF